MGGEWALGDEWGLVQGNGEVWADAGLEGGGRGDLIEDEQEDENEEEGEEEAAGRWVLEDGRGAG